MARQLCHSYIIQYVPTNANTFTHYWLTLSQNNFFLLFGIVLYFQVLVIVLILITKPQHVSLHRVFKLAGLALAQQTLHPNTQHLNLLGLHQPCTQTYIVHWQITNKNQCNSSPPHSSPICQDNASINKPYTSFLPCHIVSSLSSIKIHKFLKVCNVRSCAGRKSHCTIKQLYKLK